MLQGEHSAILSTFIKLPFVIKIFVLSIFEWPLYTGFTVEVTCDFQQCGILTSVDSDEPLQPPFKLRNSKCCSDSSLTVIEYSSD